MVNIKLILGIVVLTFFIFGCAETQQVRDEYEQQPVDESSTEEIDEEQPVEELGEDEVVEDVQEPVDKIVDEIDEQTVDELDEDEIVEETLGGITEEQISENNSVDSCWVGYYGNVYDLTQWLNEHPGGLEPISPHCGTIIEFTEAYDDRHGVKEVLNRNEPFDVII